MTSLEVVLFSFAQTLSELATGASIYHHQIIAHFMGTSAPPELLIARAEWGIVAAMIVYFRHDILSQLSSLIQLIAYRKKPVSVDDYSPLFVIVSFIPFGITLIFMSMLSQLNLILIDQPIQGISAYAIGTLVFIVSDYYSKNKRSLYDWNYLDALLIGIAQCLYFVNPISRVIAVLTMARLRGYKRQALMKFVLISSIPLYALSAILHGYDLNLLGYFQQSTDMSRLNQGISFVIAFASSLFILRILTDEKSQDFKKIWIYRFIFGIMMIYYFWIRAT